MYEPNEFHLPLKLRRHTLFAMIGLILLPSLLTAAPPEREPAQFRRVVAVENVCAWPNLTLMRDGTIIAVIHTQPSHGQAEGDIACYASLDGLKWEKRSTITEHEPKTIRMNHAAGLARNGDLIVLCSGWSDIPKPPRLKQAPFRESVLRPWVLRSSDGGNTWEKRDAFRGADAGWSEHVPFGDIWAADDGALHTSCYQGEFVNEKTSMKTKGFRSWHFQSDDDGWTWTRVSIIGPKHSETDIVPLGGTAFLAAARADATELFRSEDNGMSWQGPVRITDKNEINAHLARLNDGRLLLSYGVRVARRYGVYAKFSRDDGKTWSAPLRLAHASDADCGYPSSVQLKDGSIVTAWYAKDTPDRKGYQMGVTVWHAP